MSLISVPHAESFCKRFKSLCRVIGSLDLETISICRACELSVRKIALPR
jgi:hypothetical protein